MEHCPLPGAGDGRMPNNASVAATPAPAAVLCTARDTPAYLQCSAAPFPEAVCNQTCSTAGCGREASEAWLSSGARF